MTCENGRTTNGVRSVELAADEIGILKMLASSGRRPNCLFICPPAAIGAVVKAASPLGAPPVMRCTLPGELRLPDATTGTLVLADVAALSIDQQVVLSDWLVYGRRDVQVMAFSSTPLYPKVTQGQFLEGLYYRLNVVHVDVTKGF